MKENSFPSILCAERNTLLEGLAWSSFFSPNFPWAWDYMEGPHTHRKRQTNIQTSVTSHFLCRRERSSGPRFDWIILGSCGNTLWVWTWIPNLGGKIPIFFSVGPKVVRLNYCLKIHPIAVFSVMTALDLLQPFAFVKEASSMQLLTAGPFEVDCDLD